MTKQLDEHAEYALAKQRHRMYPQMMNRAANKLKHFNKENQKYHRNQHK